LETKWFLQLELAGIFLFCSYLLYIKSTLRVGEKNL
jgi:hypothetical protein